LVPARAKALAAALALESAAKTVPQMEMVKGPGLGQEMENESEEASVAGLEGASAHETEQVTEVAWEGATEYVLELVLALPKEP